MVARCDVQDSVPFETSSLLSAYHNPQHRVLVKLLLASHRWKGAQHHCYRSSESVSRATVIGTGANTGLGLEAARHCACLDASNVILAVRDLPKRAEANVSIQSSTSCCPILVLSLDLLSYASVDAFASQACTQLHRIDPIVLKEGFGSETFCPAEALELINTTRISISTLLLA
ncbi:hypothetical protein HO173_009799 [Letharia columbiana]|uniref:Uncharacterized protein n=1 Tax=Letharia columbiana TaxID=112416 RepID=A0A8H6L1F5_9LECA|nr:uncharacterized protein HO173_009799 [Letharia columbiana]KAF6231962.1 hypothetical protein HO173_009799 [Letharia columbiana]